MKKESLIGLMLLVVGFLLLAYQVYSFAAHESIFDLASIRAAQEAQLRLPLTPLFGAVAMFAGVVLIVRDRDRAS
jgi:small-conductance mechanosensitive channel